MSSALLRLRESYTTFSPTEQEVAGHILSDPQTVVDMSIHELARHTLSSASTIVRLCNHTGYSGYKEFRRAVTYELAMQEKAKWTDRREIAQSDSLEEIIDKITYKNSISLEETKDLVDVTELQACVDLICNARTIYLFGMGASLCAAKDACLKFLRLNRMCVISDDWHSQLLQARNAAAQDLGIVISYSGNTAEVLECMKALKQNGTPIIAITRCVHTPVSELADHKLYTAANETIYRSGDMSAQISQLNIIDILYTAVANVHYEESLKLLSKTYIQNQANVIGITAV